MSDRALTAWNALLESALKLPGVRIQRASFLATVLAQQVAEDVARQAVASTPHRAGIVAGVVARVSKKTIAEHRALVTATSTLAGLPGGLWTFGTVPVDLTQFFWHVLMVSQKLAYLHGWPELMPHERELDEETKLVLTLFVGVVLGVQGSSTGLSKLSNDVSRQVLEQLPEAPLSKLALRKAALQVARWLGVRLTKKTCSELLGRAVPLVGGAVGGAVSWYAFGSGTERLRQHLASRGPAGA